MGVTSEDPFLFVIDTVIDNDISINPIKSLGIKVKDEFN